MAIPSEVIDRAIADCEQRILDAQEIIDSIEKDGWRFYAAHGDERMRDVTNERLERHQRIQAQARELAEAYERHRSA